jgi:hypothetical protein
LDDVEHLVNRLQPIIII